MFTGIIEEISSITAIIESQTNRTFTLQAVLTTELKVDQSVSHNGVCLTVTEINGSTYKVTAIAETIKKTTLGLWEVGNSINIERCLQFNGRIDGHIVQGHVDTVGVCTTYKEMDGSWEYQITIPEEFAHLIIEKGSISLNGISLTIFNVTKTTFTVAIIPYTYEHTNMHNLTIGDKVNIEFDMIGKYVARWKGIN